MTGPTQPGSWEGALSIAGRRRLTMPSNPYIAGNGGIAVGSPRAVLLGRLMQAACEASVEHLTLLADAAEYWVGEDAAESSVPLRMAGSEVAWTGDPDA